MKRVLTLLTALMAFAFAAFAQEASPEVTAFIENAQKHRTVLSYEYTIQGPTDVKVQGKATVQENCFRMEGAGLMILCDGASIWTLDLEGKEAYVEKAGPMDYMKYLRDIEFNNGVIEGTYAEPMSGALIPFAISDVQYLPKSGDMSPFSPSDDTFADGDWIITDLR